MMNKDRKALWFIRGCSEGGGGEVAVDSSGFLKNVPVVVRASSSEMGGCFQGS